MKKIQNLIAGHAFWADKKRELKASTIKAYHSCEFVTDAGGKIISLTYDDHCFARAWSDYSTCRAEDGPYECTSFKSVLEGTEICKSCKKYIELKSELAIASRRLGCIRAAITKVGRKMGYSDNKDLK